MPTPHIRRNIGSRWGPVNGCIKIKKKNNRQLTSSTGGTESTLQPSKDQINTYPFGSRWIHWQTRTLDHFLCRWSIWSNNKTVQPKVFRFYGRNVSRTTAVCGPRSRRFVRIILVCSAFGIGRWSTAAVWVYASRKKVLELWQPEDGEEKKIAFTAKPIDTRKRAKITPAGALQWMVYVFGTHTHTPHWTADQVYWNGVHSVHVSNYY